MPELPEVETTRRGIASVVTGQAITTVTVRDRRLRWPIPAGFENAVAGRRILGVERRAKYLLLRTDGGTLLIHLGMSGSLRAVDGGPPARLHDHVELGLANGMLLRFNDPRRFGSFHYVTGDVSQHPLLATLGPEPLAEDFTAELLFRRSRRRKIAVKQFIMDAHVVVGVGNIYASEALFRAGIRPGRAAGRLTLHTRIQRGRGARRLILDHDTRLDNVRHVAIGNQDSVVLHLERACLEGGRRAVHKQVALDREVVGEGRVSTDRQGAAHGGRA